MSLKIHIGQKLPGLFEGVRRQERNRGKGATLNKQLGENDHNIESNSVILFIYTGF